MKQTEIFRKAKPRFCDYMFLKPIMKVCGKPAVVTIHKGSYCAEHSEQASRMFGQATPICQ